jgi:hypothetical protein
MIDRLRWTALACLLPLCVAGCHTGETTSSVASNSNQARTATQDSAVEPVKAESRPHREADEPRTAPSGPESEPGGPPAEIVLRPFSGVIVYPDRPAVHLESLVCIEAGWLEQIACAPGTREHESLVVPDATPSQVHAALLGAGFEPGRPGRWSIEDGEFAFVSPEGSALRIDVRHERDTGEVVEEPIRNWIRDHLGRREFPDEPWIFGGSQIRPNPEWMGPGEHYVADLTGSIIGLVTFGDEVIGYSTVLADAAAVQAPEWEANAGYIPPVGTKVTLIIRPWECAETPTAETRRVPRRETPKPGSR